MKVSYKLFKKIFNNLRGEPEITFKISNKEYMLIKCENYVTFQENTMEIKYNSLDELYDLVLKEKWNEIEDIIIDEGLSFMDDLDYIIQKLGGKI